MARLLHDDGDLGRDMSGNVGGTGDCSGSSSCGHHRRRHHERLIRIGDVTIDCTPVRFATRGQAKNVVSCASTQTVTVPVTQTTTVQTPGPDGCITCTPVTRTVQMPVTTTVNVPPVLVPVPRTVCPPSVLPCGCGCSNP